MIQTTTFNEELVAAFWNQTSVVSNGQTMTLPSRQTGGKWSQNNAYDVLVARSIRTGNYTTTHRPDGTLGVIVTKF
jgi:hypothetical protein